MKANLALLLISQLLLSGCSFRPSDDPNHIVVWAWPGAIQSLESGYPEFQKAYPEITVEFVEIPWSGGGLPTKLQVVIMSRSGFPDVVGLTYVFASQFIENGALWNVTDHIAPYIKDFFPYTIDFCVDSKGKMRGVPWDVSPIGLYYRKDIFDKYKEPVPRTWDEFIEVGKRMAKHGHYMLNFPSNARQNTLDIFDTLLQQQGGAFFSRDRRVILKSAEAKRALEFMLRMQREGITIDAGDGPSEWSAFKEGIVITRLCPSWGVNLFQSYVGQKPEDGYGCWAVASLPAFEPNGSYASAGVCSLLAIPELSAKKEAAWKFISFMLASVEGSRTANEYGQMSAYIPSVRMPEIIDKKLPFFGGQQVNRLFYDICLKVPTNYFVPPEYSEAQRIFLEELEALWSNKKTVEETLDSAQRRIEEIQGDYQ